MAKKKAITGSSIPSKVLKLSAYISVYVPQNCFNNMLVTGSFPDDVKLADTTSAFLKKDPLKKNTIGL